MKYTVVFICFIFSSLAFSQPLNKKTIFGNCEDYQLNTKKIKVWWEEMDHIIENIEKVTVELDSISVPSSKCTKKHIVFFTKGEGLEKSLESAIKKSFPKNIEARVWIKITDVRIINNMLPTSNPRIYMSLDYLYKNELGVYEKVYSSTKFQEFIRFIEKPLSRMINESTRSFLIKKHKLKLMNSSNTLAEKIQKGIYSSFEQLRDNRPFFVNDLSLIPVSDKKKIIKYQLKDIDYDSDIFNSTLFINDGEDTYLNVNYYYPRYHFTKVSKLDSNYFFIYDQIYDRAQAARNTGAYGGGLLGAVIASATTQAKLPALINKKTGLLTAFLLNDIEKIFPNQPDIIDKYKLILKNGDRESLIVFFKQLLSNNKIFKLE
ncbi:MAG: hypothetical protein AB8B61_00400 [Cyclobacteriaceae bacterium]